MEQIKTEPVSSYTSSARVTPCTMSHGAGDPEPPVVAHREDLA